ncbi:kinase-like domain-containing protein [Chytriomyces sp. MP71]|nr:kinase-like domain-containing protein [Chytriomyces sp. MP71]
MASTSLDTIAGLRRPLSMTTSATEGGEWGILASIDEPGIPSVSLTRAGAHGKTGYLIGRHPECDIVVNHSQVSKRHGLVLMEALDNKSGSADYDVYIEDMSANGIFVNGARIEKGKRFKLSNGDEIQLAKNKGSSKNKEGDKFWIFKRPQTKPISPFDETFEMTRELGTGNFATVKLGTHRTSGKHHAVKILNKKMFEGNAKVLQNLEQEIGILMAVSHPCIIKLDGVFDMPKTVNIVMEFAKGGELFDRIITKGKFTEDETRVIMIQLFNALDYLHAREIVHRDLKPENILLASDKLSDFRIKVSDFGLAKLVPSFTSTLCGTPNYVAPEVLLGKSNRAYGSAVDLWSCGVILYICLVGQPPFSEELAPPSMMDQIKMAKFSFPSPWWDGISREAKDLIRKLIVVDPSKRLTSKQAQAHPWIRDHVERLRREEAVSQLKHQTYVKYDTILTKHVPVDGPDETSYHGEIGSHAGKEEEDVEGDAFESFEGEEQDEITSTPKLGKRSFGESTQSTPAKKAKLDEE